MPTCYIIAGPNGAGQTTFATEYLPNEAACIDFVNADLIAQGLSPFDPGKERLAAGRLLLQRVDHLAASGEDFAFETTLSGDTYRERISSWRSNGYRVILIFLQLPDPEMAIARVKNRVEEGGHDVPRETIERRFHRGLENLDEYKSLGNEWIIYDNSSMIPTVVSHGANQRAD